MRTIGIGVIGMGWMGTVHSRAYRMVPDRFPQSEIQPRLVICADEVESRAVDGQRRLGFERQATDWRRVADDPEVEVVSVTVPNHLHLGVVRALCDSGKHVLCEKPVGRSPRETAEIARLAQQAGILNFVGFNYRWAPAVQYARRLIGEGGLGRLTHYKGHLLVGYASDPRSVLSWRLQHSLAGMGALGDLLSHAIDMAHMIAGSIRRVVSQKETFIAERPLATTGEGDHYSVKTGGPTGKVTNEDYVGALVEFDSGVRGTLEACRVIQGPRSEIGFRVHGTQGALSWEFERMNEFELYLASDEQGQRGYRRVVAGPEHPAHGNFGPGAGVGLGYDDLKVIEANEFLQSVATGVQGEPGFAQALAVAKVQAAIARSWQSDGWETVVDVN